MNPQGTSFIPQRPTSGTIKRGGVKKVYILTYISFVVFFATLVGTAGTYAYQQYEQTQLNKEKKLLADEKAKFNETDLDTIRQLYYRMQNAKEKLDAHISLLPIFKALEESSVQSLIFKGFLFNRVNQDAPTISFSGTASDFNSVMFQRGLLESSALFSESVVSNLSLVNNKVSDESTQSSAESDKTVSFTVTAPIKASLIGFTAPVSTSSDETLQMGTDTQVSSSSVTSQTSQ